MEIETYPCDGRLVAVVNADKDSIKSGQDALDLMMTIRYESGCEAIVLSKEAFAPAFFVLSSGLAGEVLQKFVNYRVKLAIYGDFTGYQSKPLRDFIRESNEGKDIFFASDKASALEKLAKA